MPHPYLVLHSYALRWYCKIHRITIAASSLVASRDRLKKARLQLAKGDRQLSAERQRLHGRLRTYGNYCSQVGCQRPLSASQFSPDGKMLATASWSGLCKLWTVPDCKEIKSLRGHQQRVGAVVWHPKAGIGQDASAVNLVSCDVLGKVQCWSMGSEEPIASLEGHEKRVSRVAFHPTGDYLGTACYDNSWRLWDVNRQTEILHQEGHSKPVYTICFHKDGGVSSLFLGCQLLILSSNWLRCDVNCLIYDKLSFILLFIYQFVQLVGTAGLDCFPRIWDLRSGRNILTLEGHVQNVLAMDFSPNGYHCVTGSEDHTVTTSLQSHT